MTINHISEETAQRLIESMERLNRIICESMGVRQAEDLETDRLLSRAEAAEYCKVSVYTINNYRRDGKITKVIRGCRTGYMRSDLDRVKKERRSRSHKKTN